MQRRFRSTCNLREVNQVDCVGDMDLDRILARFMRALSRQRQQREQRQAGLKVYLNTVLGGRRGGLVYA